MHPVIKEILDMSTFSPLRHRLLSFCFSLLIIGFLITVVILAKETTLLKDETIEIREIRLATPPPPPPPPPQAQQVESDAAPSLDLSVSGAGVAMEFTEIKMKNSIDLSELEDPKVNSLQQDWNDSLSVNWNDFGLGELDEIPRLLTNIKIEEYPQALIRRKIYHIKVVLNVFVDETGKTTLRQIRKNPYPEIEATIKRLVKKTRFSVPTKDGRPVRASFDWPVEFSK